MLESLAILLFVVQLVLVVIIKKLLWKELTAG